MNIAFFLKPKHEVAFLYGHQTLRQGLEKLRQHGYSAIPVLTRESKYAGTVSEGDFLRYLLDHPVEDLSAAEGVSLGEALRPDAAKNPPVRITQSLEELLLRAVHQNFIPVVDDYDSFIGIVTRQDILSYFYREFVVPASKSAEGAEGAEREDTAPQP